ncbi:THUMP domain-containing protein [Candidatus Nitrosocosmicus agrestis]|jgi:tRNA acetyltransferase TAN1|uniref:THUMP domain-containing protein n=1 Tax=Candidatus Nitrosocosmicus agrestis TaxID=2563600 RepID=UPI00122DF27A|nr:THUMP domain-containing protein [Candidatus Nitrosocosmicus sp. SS]KAA2282145.1 RNA methyltransferase [Candidatus Nitrosocosmicus sp. SS]KAF0870009.1 RNA methyltransferase [Candidatus Nitrosocosmicus sp. SS]MDR4492763.1 THUMP domain-containing protein [Candidatus Nitrosocosmicus sp.]
MEFNFVATTHRFAEEDLMDELENLFYEFGEKEAEVDATNVSGLIVGKSSRDPKEFISFLRMKLQDSSWEIRYLLRFIPIQKVVTTDIENIKKSVLELASTAPIQEDQTIKIAVEKRHTKLQKMEIIDYIGPDLNYRVDLTNPDWIFLIEIIGKFTGISILPINAIFSSMIEKRVI